MAPKFCFLVLPYGNHGFQRQFWSPRRKNRASATRHKHSVFPHSVETEMFHFLVLSGLKLVLVVNIFVQVSHTSLIQAYLKKKKTKTKTKELGRKYNKGIFHSLHTQ